MFQTFSAVIVLLISLATTTAVRASDRCEELRKLQVHFDALSPEQQEYYNTLPGITPRVVDPWAKAVEPTKIEEYRDLRWQIFKGWATNSTALTMDRLETALNELRCLGDYRPMSKCHLLGKVKKVDPRKDNLQSACFSATRQGVKNTTAAELATAYEGRKTRLIAKLKCDADPKCVAERKKTALLDSLCFDIQELAETKTRLLQRRKDAVEHGVINAKEQHDDIEIKNHLMEAIQGSKAEFKKMVGRPFKPRDCREVHTDYMR